MKDPINQHKSMAMGHGLQKCDESNKEDVPSPWGEGTRHPGKIRKSGTSTGSGGRSGSFGMTSDSVTPP